MRCPRCFQEVSGERCPHCGAVLPSLELDEQSPLSKQGAIHFETNSRSLGTLPTAPDWRKEVREKLERHQLRKEGTESVAEPQSKASELKEKARRRADPKKDKTEGQASSSRTPPAEISRKLFTYRLNENRLESDRRIITFRQNKNEVAKPVIRKTSKPPRRPESNDRQRPLELVQKSGVAPQGEGLADDLLIRQSQDSEILFQEQEGAEHEALFSRILAGLLDLIVSLLLGGIFGLVGASLMSVDLTSPAVIELAASCALAFWFLNNAFFLFVAHQTPGMMVTDLELISEERSDLGMLRILIRIFLQVLSTLSVVGLLWSIFDAQGRCWHDRVSRTMVVPMLPDVPSPPGPQVPGP